MGCSRFLVGERVEVTVILTGELSGFGTRSGLVIQKNFTEMIQSLISLTQLISDHFNVIFHDLGVVLEIHILWGEKGNLDREDKQRKKNKTKPKPLHILNYR